MACDIDALVSDSRCLLSLSDRQLLAAIAYLLAVAGGEDPTPANLTTLGSCLTQAMSPQQLLAAIAYLQCSAA